MKIQDCYCYNEKCNQLEWEKQGKTGKRQYTVVHDVYAKGLGLKPPVCPYCKKKMVVNNRPTT